MGVKNCDIDRKIRENVFKSEKSKNFRFSTTMVPILYSLSTNELLDEKHQSIHVIDLNLKTF